MKKIPIHEVTPKQEGKQGQESYDLYAKREHIYVRNYHGLFKNLRVAANAVLFAMFFGFSWLNWDGKQAVLFDLPNRQFYVFGTTFWPQDFVLLSFLLIILAFFLFFVTVFAGRIWCGYTCPQFVWTWLFIWVERITEGDRNARMKRDKQPMTLSKGLRKLAKHSLWVIIAVVSSIAFVGYFTPIRELVPAVFSFELGPWELWWLGFIAFATYGNAGWLREQVCIYMCPYARFQSVMFDQDTLVVSYDEKRGETRGPRKKNQDYKAEGLGDCIDCKACVHVCPVGIDIRDGLQYECVACGACVDACDEIMDRVGYERGLVKYTTEHALEGKKTHFLRPRLIGYFAVMVLMVGGFVYSLSARVPIEVDVLRDRGQLFTPVAGNQIENVYTLKVANKEEVDHNYSLTLSGIDGLELVGDSFFSVAAGSRKDITIKVRADVNSLTKVSSNIVFIVEATSASDIYVEREGRFLGPPPKR